MKKSGIVAALCIAASACTVGGSQNASTPSTSRAVAPLGNERHFKGLRQITFGSENAEAYFSHDGKWLTLPVSSKDELRDVTELLAMKRPPLPR